MQWPCAPRAAIGRNILIIASRVNESYDASPGHIRGYDTVTGQMKWIC